MTGLLVFREKMKEFYGKNEVFILPAIRFLFALLALSTINNTLGYMSKLDNFAIVLIVSLMCSFLPAGATMLFGALFSLLHMYALSLEAALIGLVVYLLLFLLFMRFNNGESIIALVTAVLCIMKIPYVMPIAMGLIGTPASAVPLGCGVVIYYLFLTVTGNASTIGTMGEEELMAKIRLLIDSFLGNKAMWVVVAAFVITMLAVYLIRRMSVDHSWTIAIVAGVIIDLLILLVGDLIYDINVSVINIILGAVVAVLAAKVIEFLRFCVDYSRTEKVQFEDDEYYYYVKAVPKMTVAAPDKTVKKINTPNRGMSGRSGSARSGIARPVGTKTPPVRKQVDGRGRTVTTTTSAGKMHRADYLNDGHSMTVRGNEANLQGDDYEEFY